MENNDTNTDYKRFVRVGDQNWEIVQVTIGIISSAWDLYSLFIIPGDFKPCLKKITPPHLKCQFPPKIPIWPYINVMKNVCDVGACKPCCYCSFISYPTLTENFPSSQTFVHPFTDFFHLPIKTKKILHFIESNACHMPLPWE